MPGLRFSALRLFLLVCGVALAAQGQVLLPPNDFRISDMGTDGETAPIAIIPAVAYNATNHEYLVVWYGDQGGVGESEVYGQRINAATGAEVGTNDFRISDMGPDGDSNYKVSDLDVVWNATANEYLVVWRGDDNTGTLVNDEFEIFGQRIAGATGAEVGTNDFRISSMGTNGMTDAVADVPAVIWNATNNEYLVVWRGHDGDQEFEIWGQRLSATGAEVGTNDFRISDAGNEGDMFRLALDAKVAWNSVNNEYLVVWQADDLISDNEVEIFGQRLSATGAELGTNDFRISDMGVDGDTDVRGQGPAVAYNPTHNEYLVVFYGTDPGFVGAEVVGQRLAGATGFEIGTNDFLISDAGPDDLYNVNYPSVEYSTGLGAYLVVWPADDNQGSTVDNEFEIWGQLIEGGTGSAIGTNDFRISDAGPDGDPSYSAGDPDVAFDANGIALVVWRADDDTSPLVDGENEIFGQRIGTGSAATEDFTGDGLNDILWRQPSTGKNVWWAMSGTSRLSYGSLLDVPGTTWSIGGTGDFSADGKPDILWRNSSTGQNVVWIMNGTVRSSYVTLLSVVGSAWEIGGVDDFDGDGDADIVWRNGSTGQNVLWTMNGTTRASYASLLSVTGAQWRMVAIGDLTGDGKPDIVWRNGSTGQNVLWTMNGATRTSLTTMLSVPDAAWRIMATADYDGDADADLVWRNVSSGQNIVWFMNGATRTSYGSLLTVSDLSWEVQGPR